MVWLRNKYGGWFEIPDDQYDASRASTKASEDTKERQLAQSKKEADRLNEEDKKAELHKYASQLINEAHKHEPQVTADLKDIVKQDGAELAGLEYRFKGEKSLSEKLERKSIEKGISVHEYSKKVTDVLRYTEMSSEDTLQRNFDSFVSKINERGYEMVEVNNSWYDGSDYKGINTLVRTSRGYVFEMQFHTPKSLEIKEINHKLYEKQREVGTSKKEQLRLKRQMASNARSVPTPIHIEKIKNKG